MPRTEPPLPKPSGTHLGYPCRCRLGSSGSPTLASQSRMQVTEGWAKGVLKERSRLRATAWKRDEEKDYSPSGAGAAADGGANGPVSLQGAS